MSVVGDGVLPRGLGGVGVSPVNATYFAASPSKANVNATRDICFVIFIFSGIFGFCSYFLNTLIGAKLWEVCLYYGCFVCRDISRLCWSGGPNYKTVPESPSTRRKKKYSVLGEDQSIRIKVLSSHHRQLGQIMLSKADITGYNDSGIIFRPIEMNEEQANTLLNGCLRFRYLRVRNLRFEVKRCTNLSKSDMFGKGDPFVRVRSNCGVAQHFEHNNSHGVDVFHEDHIEDMEVYRTTTIQNNSSPAWLDAAFDLRLPSKINKVTFISLDVMDDDGHFKSADFLGTVSLRGDQILRLADGQEQTLSLSKKAGHRRMSLVNKHVHGDITIKLHLSEEILFQPIEIENLQLATDQISVDEASLQEPYLVIDRNDKQVHVTREAKSIKKVEHGEIGGGWTINMNPKWEADLLLEIPVATQQLVEAHDSKPPCSSTGDLPAICGIDTDFKDVASKKTDDLVPHKNLPRSPHGKLEPITASQLSPAGAGALAGPQSLPSAPWG